VLTVKTAGPVSFQTMSDGHWHWRADKATPRMPDKGPGMEGPIAAAFAGPHIYVYGSLQARTDQELAERRQEAETAAEWNGRWRLALTQTVKADTELTAEEIASANLILFGTAATNALIARFAPEMPMALNPGAADYGLVFIAPERSRYVVVSSGLPWWTGAEEAARGGDPLQPRQLRILSTLGDYILFRGSLGHVVAEGRFDRWWRLPAEAAAKMAASGTITIRTIPQ